MSTTIEWVRNPDGTPGVTWNPVTGCTPISAGCQHCYAKRMANRLRGRYGYPKDEPFKPTFHPDRLDKPKHWRKPRMVFVVSMGDLFHETVPSGWIASTFQAMSMAPWHTYLLLTKRPERMRYEMRWWAVRHGGAQPNWWLGVTAENQDAADERIPLLLQTPAAVRFVSIEPMLSGIDLAPYIGYNPMKKGATHEADGDRESRLRSGNVGPAGDHARRHHMEGRRNARQPLEPSPDDAEGEAPARRTRSRAISSGSADDGREEGYVPSTPVGLETLQWADPARHDDQSQKRTEEGQSTRESGAGDVLGKYEACLQDRPERRMRRDQPERQVVRQSRRSYQGDLCGGKEDASTARGNVRSGLPDDLEDCAGQEPKKTGGAVCGLHSLETAHGKRTGQPRALSLCIVGGETGPGARPMHPDWARSIRDQCQAAGVPFFFKHWGEWMHETELTRDMAAAVREEALFPEDSRPFFRVPKKTTGRLLDGREWNEMPEGTTHGR